MKTAELKGAALDYAAAVADGLKVVNYRNWLETENAYWKGKDCSWVRTPEYRILTPEGTVGDIKKVSTNWVYGGPIIERERITIEAQSDKWRAVLDWLDEPYGEGFGETPLIAAMRCYVASKLGSDVEIPEELL